MGSVGVDPVVVVVSVVFSIVVVVSL